ncbi:MAG: NfeD family protein [Verrucomicrobiales bacterium]
MIGVIILLLLGGVTLLGVEFVVPGAIIGILGVGALVAAVILSFVHYGVGAGLGVAALALLTTAAFLVLWVKFFHRTYFGRKLTLKNEVGGNELCEKRADLLRKRGEALTDLHPAGKGIFDGRRVDIVAETGFIEKGKTLEIIKIEGIRVVVREVAAEPPSTDKNA